MAEYQSQYPELGFYVEGERKAFGGGRYVTEDEKEIKVLDGLIDAVRVDKPEPVTKPKRATTKK